MATRFYYHSALSGLSNLPTTKQNSSPGTLYSGNQVDAYTVNRTMTPTIGTASVLQTFNSEPNTALQQAYFTRFVSDALAAQTISANTWTYNITMWTTGANSEFPVDGTNDVQHVSVYVWRPGSGIVGHILNGNSNGTWSDWNIVNAWFCNHTTFSGSSVVCQDGDVLCQEIVYYFTQIDSVAYDNYIAYDGETVNTTNGQQTANPTDAASFLETPQNLSFYTPPTNIEMTVESTKNLNSKFITTIV